MMKHKRLALLTAGVLAATMVGGGSYAMSTTAEETDLVDSTVKIMALGDSITDGYGNAGAYRKYLYHELEQRGYDNIDMVGPKGGDSESFNYDGSYVTYDGNYAGYSGYAIQYITGTETRQGILETIQSDYGNGQNMIEAYDPDVILLQIGTNDILSNYNDGITNRLENLIDTILTSMDGTDDVLYVSTIPDINVAERYDWLWAYGMSYQADPEGFTAKVQGCIDSYNASIQTLVSQKQAAGERVAFADIHSVVDQNTDLADGVHPNDQGYEKMGKYWANLLDTTYLDDVNTPVEPAETTTSILAETTTLVETTTSNETTTITEGSTTAEASTTAEDTATTTEETTTAEASTTAEDTATTVEETTTTEDTTITEDTTTDTTAQTPGDVNLDGTVNLADVVLFQRYLLGVEPLTAHQAQAADLNQDRMLSGLDLALLRQLVMQGTTA